MGASGRQPGGQNFQTGQQTGLALQDVESPQQRAAVEGLTRSIQVCEWCATQCIQLAEPDMVDCIQLCQDVSDLCRTALALIPRNSWYTEDHLRTVQNGLQSCAQECGRHQHAHCQECAHVLGQTVDALQRYFSSIEQRGWQESHHAGAYR